MAWFLLCLTVAQCNGNAGQCQGPTCAPQRPHPSVVRVVCQSGGGASLGSGTLVETDAGRSVVLTCAHVIEQGASSVAVMFTDGSRCPARVVSVDRVSDLAALEVQQPSGRAVAIATRAPRTGETVTWCGYGTDGRYACRSGRVAGYARTGSMVSHETLTIHGACRSGDSGGPVFNAAGELVAVAWGTDSRIVCGTHCGRVRRFLQSLPEPIHRPPVKPITPPSRPPVLADAFESIRGRLDGLADRVSRNEDSTRPEQLRETLRDVAGDLVDGATRPGVLEVALPSVLTALGWTTPPSLAAMLALRLGMTLLRRHREHQRRADPAMDVPFRPIHDDYAEQLARVHALSGRSPWGDVTLGREYDAALRRAETSSDAALAAMASTIRNQVAGRFHRIHGPAPSPAEPLVT